MKTVKELREEIKTETATQILNKGARRRTLADFRFDKSAEQPFLWSHEAVMQQRNRLRYLHLAYAFARGRTYASVEAKTHMPPSAWNAALALGDTSLRETVYAWIQGKPVQMETEVAA